MSLLTKTVTFKPWISAQSARKSHNATRQRHIQHFRRFDILKTDNRCQASEAIINFRIKKIRANLTF